MKIANLIAIAVVIFSSFVRLVISFLILEGIGVAGMELLVNLALCLFFAYSYRWARGGLAAVAIANLIYFVVRGFADWEFLLAIFELSVSLCILILLLGRPTKGRGYLGLGLYVIVLLSFGAAAAFRAPTHPAIEEALAPTYPTQIFHSKHNYQVSTNGQPWNQLTKDQANELWGSKLQEADMALSRDDGTAFALFFPLSFNNVTYNPEIGKELESEIRHKWLTGLEDWTRYPMNDGFVLSAHGKVDNAPISYVVLYKHFGNLGLYGVFWTEGEYSERLLNEVITFYEGIGATPLKERLTKLTAAQVYDQNSFAVVDITLGEDRGSGFNIAPTGLVVTPIPLLATGPAATISFPGGDTFDHPKITAITDMDVGIALLTLDAIHLPTVQTLGSVPIEIGDQVYIFETVGTLTPTRISAVQSPSFELKLGVEEATIGSPVFNEFGEVIGIMIGPNTAVEIAVLDELHVLPAPVTIEQFHRAVNPE